MNNNEYFFSFFPQFCSDPINDKAWGEGFTDWNLVSQLKPEEAACFTPKIGFYNTTDSFYLEYLVEELNILRSLRAGLMIYHYYFDGVHALDQFEKNFLAADTGCPFFLCWANESWTKRWIGKPKDVIIRQDHLPDKDTIRSHVKYLIQFFDKPNYRRHNGRPILI
ncbi:MAG: glycoside hydrolase family 99-like domain-containing protein, partial [bacterium]